MKNLDQIKMEKIELLNRLSQALKDGDESQMTQAFTDFAELVQKNVIDEAQSVMQAADKNTLSARGVRQLTSQETKFYQGLISAMSGSNPRQALTDLEVAMPESIIDSVIGDVKTDHPLLNAITFVNTMGVTKMIVNKGGVQLAAWGKLGTAITKELAGAIDLLNTTLCKLTAFIPVSKDMLELGPTWVDAYVREILTEAVAVSSETAIVDGTGKDEPIGMTRSVAEGVAVVDGVYPHKNTVALSEISPTTIGAILATLAKNPQGKPRTVENILFIVNPVDYFSKVMPATTVRASDGTYSNNVLPYPMQIIQSVGLESGKAIIGLAKKYFLGVGATGKQGKIEYSDEYQFLEDNRVYISKLYANGLPLDDNAFVYCDISALTAQDLKVQVTNTTAKPVNTKEVSA